MFQPIGGMMEIPLAFQRALSESTDHASEADVGDDPPEGDGRCPGHVSEDTRTGDGTRGDR